MESGNGVENHSYQFDEAGEQDLVQVLAINDSENDLKKKKKKRSRRKSEQTSNTGSIHDSVSASQGDENDEVQSLVEIDTKPPRARRRKSDSVSLVDSVLESVATALEDNSEIQSKSKTSYSDVEDTQILELGLKPRAKRRKSDCISLVGSVQESTATVLDDHSEIQSESKKSHNDDDDEDSQSFKAGTKSSRARKQKSDSTSLVGSPTDSITTALESNSGITDRGKKSRSARKQIPEQISLSDSPQSSVPTVLKEEHQSPEFDRKSSRRHRPSVSQEDDGRPSRRSSKSRKQYERSRTVESVISDVIRGLEDDVLLDDNHPIPDNGARRNILLLDGNKVHCIFLFLHKLK